MSGFTPHDPTLPTSNTSSPSSFAYSTVRQRWPKIIQNAIVTIQENLSSSAAPSLSDKSAGDEILSRLRKLLDDMHRDVPLTPLSTAHLEDDEGRNSDLASYNEELDFLASSEKGHGRSLSWRNAPWLFTECYKYRLIQTFFSSSSSKFWREFDVFSGDKEDSLTKSRAGTLELIKHFLDMVVRMQGNGEGDGEEEEERAVFEEMIQISLWGNATDLSLLTTLTMEELTSRQGKEARERSREKVLVDDTDAVFKYLRGLKMLNSGGVGEDRAKREIHVVLDNAGFELLTDLVLVGHLIQAGYAGKVILHGKRMPWFVSDVNAHDLEALISGFEGGSIWHDLDPLETQELREAGGYWRSLLKTGRLEFRAHPFWTSQHPFGRMSLVEPNLFKQLADADLVIFKGDLNYRKLVWDCIWDKTTTFAEALGAGFNGMRVLALRTCKADVVVGLKKGQEDGLEEYWERSGKYGLISYWDAKA